MNSLFSKVALCATLALVTAFPEKESQAFGHKHRAGIYDDCSIPGYDHYGYRFSPGYGCAGFGYSAYYGCAGYGHRGNGCAGLFGCARPYGCARPAYGCAGYREFHGCAGYRGLPGCASYGRYGCAAYGVYDGCYAPRYAVSYPPAYYRPIAAYRSISYAPPALPTPCCTPAATCCGPVATCCAPAPSCVGEYAQPLGAYPGSGYVTPDMAPLGEPIPASPEDGPPAAPPADDELPPDAPAF